MFGAFEEIMAVLLNHFYNEELLMRQWIEHHKVLFEDAILIDHHSTDNSAEIIREYAPKSWKVYKSRLDCFDAVGTDQEMQDYELTIKDQWKIILNTTEFLWCQHFEEFEHDCDCHADITHIAFQMYNMVDPPGSPHFDKDQDVPIYANHHHGYKCTGGVRGSHRFMHNMDRGYYSPGRHAITHPDAKIDSDPELMILWYGFAPWPESIQRKLQIQERIPESDKRAQMGIQHIQNVVSIDNLWKKNLCLAGDLKDDPVWNKELENWLY